MDERPRPRSRRPGRSTVVAVTVAAAVLGAAGIGHSVWSQAARLVQEGALAAGPQPLPRFEPPPSGPLDDDAIAERVDPGLVDITTRFTDQPAGAAATGMVLTPTGEVLTNNHVIDGASNISVTDVGNGRTYDATVVGYDRSDDVAVLQMQGASRLRTVDIGDSSRVGVGDPVLALGNAGGRGGTPVSAHGRVDAVNRTIIASDDAAGNVQRLTDMIQVSANLQPGDSGGPLVNSRGEAIGMNTAAPETAPGDRGQPSPQTGFAIAISKAMAISSQIRSGTSSSTVHIGPTGFIGIRTAPAGSGSDEGDSSGSGDNPNGPLGGTGAAVVSVIPDSPAERAGLRSGDVIVALDNDTVDSPTTLTNLMLRHHPSDDVWLTWVDRSGHRHSAVTRLSTGPPS